MAEVADGGGRRHAKPLAAGDVFQIDDQGGGFGYGQVIRPGTVFYTSILQGLHDRPQAVESLSPERILLLARTTDGALMRGEWKVVGNLPVPSNVPFPNAKVLQNGVLYVTDFDGRILRKASPADADLYDNPLSVSSARLQDAWLAHSRQEDTARADPRLAFDYVRARSG